MFADVNAVINGKPVNLRVLFNRNLSFTCQVEHQGCGKRIPPKELVAIIPKKRLRLCYDCTAKLVTPESRKALTDLQAKSQQ